MNINTVFVRGLSLVLVFFLFHGNAFAWCPIAHYLIARQAATDASFPEYHVEWYANLPDYESSKAMNYTDGADIAIGQKVTPFFCWSHAVIDTGILNASYRSHDFPWPGIKLVAPSKPIYPDDGRYPGLVMKKIIDKMYFKGITDEQKKDLINTVNGFRTHNAADRQVHFKWFYGAENGKSYDDIKDSWVIHHGLKEVWADYLLLNRYGGGLDFNQFPKSALWNKSANVNSLCFKGNAALMHAAQLAFRKDRRAIKQGEQCSFPEVQSVDEIKEKLSDKNAEVTHVLNLFGISAWAKWEIASYNLVGEFEAADEQGKLLGFKVDPDTPTTNEQEYINLRYYQGYTLYRYANSNEAWKRWTRTDLYNKYEASVAAAKEWMYKPSDFTFRTK